MLAVMGATAVPSPVTYTAHAARGGWRADGTDAGAVDIRHGQDKRTIKLESGVWSLGFFDGGQLAVGLREKLYFLDPASGRVLRSVPGAMAGVDDGARLLLMNRVPPESPAVQIIEGAQGIPETYPLRQAYSIERFHCAAAGRFVAIELRPGYGRSDADLTAPEGHKKINLTTVILIDRGRKQQVPEFAGTLENLGRFSQDGDYYESTPEGKRFHLIRRRWEPYQP